MISSLAALLIGVAAAQVPIRSADAADPARWIDLYLRNERRRAGPGWWEYLGAGTAQTYHDPEFNDSLMVVNRIRAGVLRMDRSALGRVFADRPRFAAASLDAVDEVLARLARHLGPRRGLEAPHLNQHVRRLRGDIARLWPKYG